MEKNKANVVREVEASQDLVWFGQFKEQLAKVRREWSAGRGHWYLVSPCLLISFDVDRARSDRLARVVWMSI